MRYKIMDIRECVLCKDSKGRWYVLNSIGDVLCAENTCIECVGAYLRKYDVELKDFTKYVRIDHSRMIYDERDYYFTVDLIRREWDSGQHNDFDGNFTEYLREITSKNGSCEYL